MNEITKANLELLPKCEVCGQPATFLKTTTPGTTLGNLCADCYWSRWYHGDKKPEELK